MQSFKPSKDRVPELDFLRFVAASMVVLYHYTYRPMIHGVPSITAYGHVQEFSRYGYLGVSLFFLISGFVIIWSATGRTAGQFVLARFKRLYPTFWICVALTLIVIAFFGNRPEVKHAKVIAENLTMLPGYFGAPFVDGVYWTLAVEMKFYFYVFILIVAGQMPYLESWLYAWLAGLFCAMVFPMSHVLASITMLPFGFYFVGGAVFYVIRSRGLSSVRLLAVLACLAASIHYELKGVIGFTFVPVLAKPTGVVICVLLSYLAMAAVALKAVRLPRAKLLYALGALTYPLYLVHNVVGKEISLCLEPMLGNWGRLLVTGAVAYGTAFVYARWIEPVARSSVSKGLERLSTVPMHMRRVCLGKLQ
jgi:peptidoglycan/LPS O-acetylase OafA/YrhL